MSQIKSRPSFAHIKDFGKAIMAIETEYFLENNSQRIIKTGDWRLWHKSMILLPLFFVLFGMLVFTDYPNWIKICLCIALGAVTSSIGFNVGHDANHGSFSENKKVNNFFRLSFNLFGIFSFFWRTKHNILHHTYTNMNGHDEDISGVKYLRMHADQPWKPVHKFQKFYCWFFYGLLYFGWVWFNDFKKYFQGDMESKDHVTFWATKLFHLAFFVVLPIEVLGFQSWVVGYSLYCFSVGIITAIVFQLAHVVEKTSQPPAVLTMTEEEWRLHEVLTTANFGMDDKALSWFVGGLNFQIEHHLFPRVSHVHYPEISKKVQQVCLEHGVPYHKYPSFTSAVASHVRKMSELGRRPVLSFKL